MERPWPLGTGIGRAAACLLGRPLEAALKDVQSRVQHFLWNVQRRDVPNRRLSAPEEDEPVLVRVLQEHVAQARVRPEVLPVCHELRGLHESEPPPIADELVPLLHLVEALREILPELRGAGPEALRLAP